MKIRLKNFKGIKAGPELTWDGLDEIEVDFTSKQGLVAFAGENGGGKSTLLENLHHYPQLVSRGGALWQHVMGREAEKEFISSFMGHEYRSVVKMDADQGKQEGYLWRDGVPMVNGKITAFKEAVNEIFGQPFTYFRSQFCPQKSRNTQGMQIENMTAGVFRELLQQFLNLQRYAVWEDTAKQAGNILAGQIAGIDQRIKGLEEIIVGHAAIEDSIVENAKNFDLASEGVALYRHQVRTKREQVDTLKATIQSNALSIARRQDLQQQIDRLEGELAKEKAAAESEIKALGEKWTAIKKDITAVDAVLQDREAIEAAAEQVKALESQATEIQTRLDELQAELPGHQEKAHAKETEIATLRQQLKDLSNDPEILRLVKSMDEADRIIADKEREYQALESDPRLAAIVAEIKALEKAAQVGEGIDATCTSTICAAIKSVNEAKDRLPAAIKERENREAGVSRAKASLSGDMLELKEGKVRIADEKAKRIKWCEDWNKDAQEEIATADHDLRNLRQVVISTTEMITMKRQDLARVLAEIAKQKALADRLPDVRVAEQRKADLERQLQEVTEQGTKRKEKWKDFEAGNLQEQVALEEMAKQISHDIDQFAELSLSQTQKEITDIETVNIPAIEKEIQAAREKIATLQAELARINEAEQELSVAMKHREWTAIKASRWRYLQLGCGKTGLQNLRIDGAAPRIIYNANRLLSQAYGARYAVRLETQDPEGRECLNVKILMQNGKEIYLDDISPGQRGWTVQALWLAMSLLNQEKSGRKYDYFCSDESDGALDVENAEKYTALYRPFMAEAGLDRLVYISHKPSCRAMADHVLTFAHGKNPAWN